MPPPEEAFQYEKAILWRKTSQDRYNETLIGDPEELDVRWDWTRRLVRTATVDQQPIDAIAEVKERIPVGSLMVLGTLEDVQAGTGDDDFPSERLEVITCDEVKDVKCNVVAYSVTLAWYKESQPEHGGD